MGEKRSYGHIGILRWHSPRSKEKMTYEHCKKC